ncbi:hypothetical protein [Streptomyces sp. Amel2xB2]|uniref:hypothetical protein n=1 Tax=Streptomyces sp. Amel2xB2 TaxID=1305829 RepID=UPI000DBA1C02|nr:hypothetical protein [Streptomyces sp. Amel2xB2]
MRHLRYPRSRPHERWACAVSSSGTTRGRRVDLELVETRTLSSRVVYHRYRVARQVPRPVRDFADTP